MTPQATKKARREKLDELGSFGDFNQPVRRPALVA